MRPHQTENGDLSPLGSSVGNKTKGGEVLNCRKRLTGAFEQIISRKSYMDAAYNLARLLTRNEHHAEDRVQKAYLREFNAYREQLEVGCRNQQIDYVLASTEMPFDQLLDAMTGCNPSTTEYVICHAAKCGGCRHDVMEKTLIVTQ